MTKPELINDIETKIDIARAAVGIAYILGSKTWMPSFRNFIGPGEFTITSGKLDHIFIIKDPTALVARYEDFVTMEHDSINVIRWGMKDAVTQCFERTKCYSVTTGQFAKMKAQPWYETARLIRNAMSHDFVLTFGLGGHPFPDQKLQFSDRVVELKSSMEGQEITFDIFPIKCVFELCEMIRHFADATLT